MCEDLELFALLCHDVAKRAAVSSLEAEEVRLLTEDFEAFLQTPKASRTVRSVQEEHLRCCMIDFLMATL